MSINALNKVRDAHKAGAITRKEIRVITGLDEDIVDLCVDLLIDKKEIQLTELKGACTIGGCKSCGEDSTCHPREATMGPIPISISLRKV